MAAVLPTEHVAMLTCLREHRAFTHCMYFPGVQVLYMSNAVDNTPERLIVLLAVAEDLAAGKHIT